MSKRSVAIGVLLLAALTVAASAWAADQPIVLTERDCMGAPQDLVDRFARGWEGWAGFIDVYGLVSPHGRHVLDVLAPRIDLYSHNGPSGPTFPPGPTPAVIFLDSEANVVARIKVPFPYDDPGETRMTFSDWRDDYPWRIDIRIIGWAVAGTVDFPGWVWKPGGHRYEKVGLR